MQWYAFHNEPAGGTDGNNGILSPDTLTLQNQTFEEYRIFLKKLLI